jgi:hypothetical protein
MAASAGRPMRFPGHVQNRCCALFPPLAGPIPRAVWPEPVGPAAGRGPASSAEVFEL